MTSPGRYRNEPPDITDRILRLEARVQALEANPRAGNTTVDAGAFQVKDATGSVRLRMGLLSDGTYGIEVKEDGQDNFHQVPYIFSSSVDTFEGTGSTSFTDLATFGPSVTVPVRSSGRLLIMLTTQVQWPSNTGSAGPITQGGWATITASGANTISTGTAALKLLPMKLWAWALSGGIQFTNTTSVGSGSAAVFSGLAVGNTTITAKYAMVTGAANNAEFGRRNLTVIAL